MRILLLITDLELGGTPTVVRELAIRLRRAAVDVEVACLSKWGPVADQLKAAGVPVTPLNAAGAHDLRILFKLIRLIDEGRFTTVFSFLVHANAMAGAASLRVPGVRWIQSIQTTQRHPRWHWMVQRLAQHAAEKIVVPSPSVATAAMGWSGIPREKIVVIPNAIDPTDWVDAQSTIPATDPRPYPITFLGRLDPIKDIPTLVTAAHRLAPLVHLHIYGDGPDRTRIADKKGTDPLLSAHPPRHGKAQMADKMGADPFLSMHGAVDSPQAALRESGLLVLPSLAEGFGLVLIEAMAAGVPVVATAVPGIRDVVRNEETGLLVPPSDSVELAAAIRRVVEDSELRNRLIRNAKADVLHRFTWNQVIKQYLQLLVADSTT